MYVYVHLCTTPFLLSLYQIWTHVTSGDISFDVFHRWHSYLPTLGQNVCHCVPRMDEFYEQMY